MDLPSPEELKAWTIAFLSDSKRREELAAAEGLAKCDIEMKVVRDGDGGVTEVQVVFRSRTRATFEKYKKREHDLGPWCERDAFHLVKSAVEAFLGRRWKLGHFDFVPGCKRRTRPGLRRRRSGRKAPNPSTPSPKGVPQTEDKERMQEEEALRLFALIRKLDGKPTKPPSVLTVFRYYCMENRSAEEVSQLCKCSKGTVLNRLRKLRQATGMDPRALRALSAQFERIEKELSDPRARKIDRRNSMDQPGDDGIDQT